MRCVLKVLLLCCLVLTATSFGRALPGIPSTLEREMKIPGQYIIRFADDAKLSTLSSGFGMYRVGIASVDAVFDSYQAEEVRELFPGNTNKSNELSRYYVVRLPEGEDEARFLEALTANPNVLSIEQDIACPIAAIPNDPSQSSQWWVYQSSGVDIDARQAWDIEQGSDTAIVAIIDTGVLYYHPDLKNNIWVNPGEDIDGDMVVFDSTDINSADNDGNGYTDDLVGYDFVSSSSNLWPGEDGSVKDNDPKDFNGHGTHCSGIAAAVTNNSYGGCGTAGGWSKFFADRGARIMCLRAGYSVNDGGFENGVLTMSAVAEAVNYAVNNGAHVISYSAGSSYTSALRTAVNSAIAAGIVFCHAAGNDNADSPDYFATFAGLISVAATDPSDNRWVWGSGSGSNYGTWVEVAAPGNNIYSTVSNHYTAGFATYTGTSMACPMVAGLAALIKSHYPDYDKNEIDTLIINRADSINDFQFLAGNLGSGRINAHNSLSDAPSAAFIAGVLSGHVPLSVNFTDLSPAATSRNWDLDDGFTSTDPNPSAQYTTPGYKTVSLQVTDPNGTHTEVKKNYIYVSADTIYADPIVLQLGEPLSVDLKLKNDVLIDEMKIVVTFPAVGTPRLTFDSVVTTGTRTDYFDYIDIPGQSSSKVVISMKAAQTTAKDALAPGDGTILTLWFTTTGAGSLIIDKAIFGTSDSLMFTNMMTEFVPAFVPVSVTITAYQRGDANGDYSVNIGDAVYLVNYIFKGGLPPIDFPTIYAGDANADLSVNIGDAVYLVNWIFNGGPPPPA
ncbi:MAG: S8 family serine peptidase [Candidatus Zixiibacteriota bacterium]